jgi:hypothetical protein
MVLNYCFYKIHQLLIIVNVNNKQKPFTHPTVNPFFNDYYKDLNFSILNRKEVISVVLKFLI